MATIVEALGLVASKNWSKEWQNPVWKQFGELAIQETEAADA
jgi:hypothetical protein